MHRHRRPLEAQSQLVDPRLDAIAAGARRIDRQALGLVDHDRLTVDEQNAVLKVHCAANDTGPDAKQSNSDNGLPLLAAILI